MFHVVKQASVKSAPFLVAGPTKNQQQKTLDNNCANNVMCLELLKMLSVSVKNYCDLYHMIHYNNSNACVLSGF